MNYKKLKEYMSKLDTHQFKLLYSIIVHYWVKKKAFISKQNFFNLWCELNLLCSEADESFPEPYDDYELLKSFCQAHPYYFIDILAPELVINLFCQCFDDRIDILATIAHKLGVGGLRAAYEYSNEALGLSENIDVLVSEGEEHIRLCS
jgi:hypothetical protein